MIGVYKNNKIDRKLIRKLKSLILAKWLFVCRSYFKIISGVTGTQSAQRMHNGHNEFKILQAFFVFIVVRSVLCVPLHKEEQSAKSLHNGHNELRFFSRGWYVFKKI